MNRAKCCMHSDVFFSRIMKSKSCLMVAICRKGYVQRCCAKEHQFAIFLLRRHRHSYGWSLTELLATPTVIGIPCALILQVFSVIRERTRAVTCLNHIRQLGIAFGLYAQDEQSWPYGPATPSDPNAFQYYLTSAKFRSDYLDDFRIGLQY